MSIKGGSVSPRASGKRFNSILRLLGFVGVCYIDEVDVVEYTDVDWLRQLMNREPPACPVPAPPVRPTRAGRTCNSSISTVRLNAWTGRRDET